MEDDNTSTIQRNTKLFSIWLKSKKGFTNGTIQQIYENLCVIDTFLAKHFYNIPSIYSINDGDELEHLIKRVITIDEFKAMNRSTKNSLIEAFDHYYSFLKKNTAQLQTVSSNYIETNINKPKVEMLFDKLTDKQFRTFVHSLHGEGIYTIEQYHTKFQSESLIRYLNSHNLYPWQERINVAEAVSALLAKSKPESDNTHEADIKQQVQAIDQFTHYFNIDFHENRSYRYTKPRELIIHGQRMIVRSWTELLVAMCDSLMQGNVNITRSLLVTPLVPSCSRQYFSSTSKNLIQPKLLKNGMWVETNFSADSIVDICKKLCRRFGVELNDVVISFYSLKENLSKPLEIQKSTRKTGATEDVNTAQLELYIKSCGLSACTIDKIISETDQPSRMRATVTRALEASPYIVEVSRGRYIHRDNIVDLDEAGETILGILQTQFRQFDGYSNCRLLFDAVRIELSLFMNDNAFEDEATIYAVAKHLFSKECFGGNRFIFYSNMHIWEKEPNYPLSMRGVLMYRARLNGGRISRTECETFLQQIKMGQGNINQVMHSDSDSTFYQFASGEYLLSETLNIDEFWLERVKNALDRIFIDNAYVIPRDIADVWYNQLPDLSLDINWTPLLLQEVLTHNPSIGYKTVFAPLEQSRDTIAAAIVPIDSDLTFANVVCAYLSRTLELPQRMGPEDLRLILREAGMLEGNELIYNMHKALDDYCFAWSDGNKMVYIHKG